VGWETLRGQDAAVASLRRDLETGRAAHAYVFYGPEGVGKATAAHMFARALQCEGEAPPCGACTPCRKAAAGAHPDVIVVQPEIDKNTGKEKKTIGIDPVRDQVLHRAYFRPQEGRKQVFIFDRGQIVTPQAFNGLLKTLEEPPPDTILILVTPNLHALPATVVSRCRRLRFGALSRADQRAILSGLLGEGEDPDRLISMSLGRLGAALAEEADALAERREEAVAFLDGLAAPPRQADEIALLRLAVERAGGGSSARGEVLRFLEMLRGLLRDILVLQVAPGEVEPWNADLAEELAALGRRWGVRGLVDALDRVEAALVDVGVVNTNPALTLETLVFTLRATVPAGA